MTTNTDIILEQRVREVIEENGDAGKTEGIGYIFLRNIITSPRPDLEFAYDFAEHYGVSLDWLLGREIKQNEGDTGKVSSILYEPEHAKKISFIENELAAMLKRADEDIVKVKAAEGWTMNDVVYVDVFKHGRDEAIRVNVAGDSLSAIAKDVVLKVLKF